MYFCDPAGPIGECLIDPSELMLDYIGSAGATLDALPGSAQTTCTGMALPSSGPCRNVLAAAELLAQAGSAMSLYDGSAVNCSAFGNDAINRIQDPADYGSIFVAQFAGTPHEGYAAGYWGVVGASANDLSLIPNRSRPGTIGLNSSSNGAFSRGPAYLLDALAHEEAHAFGYPDDPTDSLDPAINPAEGAARACRNAVYGP